MIDLHKNQTGKKQYKCLFNNEQDCNKEFDSENYCFVILPFKLKKSKTYRKIKELVRRELGLELKNSSDFNDRNFKMFCNTVCSKIIESKFCIALLHETKDKWYKICGKPNANVWLEYGLAVALNKLVIGFIDNYDNLPFDMKDVFVHKVDLKLNSDEINKMRKAIREAGEKLGRIIGKFYLETKEWKNEKGSNRYTAQFDDNVNKPAVIYYRNWDERPIKTVKCRISSTDKYWRAAICFREKGKQIHQESFRFEIGRGSIDFKEENNRLDMQVYMKDENKNKDDLIISWKCQINGGIDLISASESQTEEKLKPKTAENYFKNNPNKIVNLKIQFEDTGRLICECESKIFEFNNPTFIDLNSLRKYDIVLMAWWDNQFEEDWSGVCFEIDPDNDIEYDN